MEKINNTINNKSEKPKNGIIKKYIKLRTLIILLVLLAFNSYAWFIFATKVSGGLSAHVTSWDVTFQVGDQESITNVEIDVSTIYPGMETYTKVITAKNTGESIANLSYKFDSLTVLGTTYAVGDEYTQEQLDSKIANDFPFKITVVIDQTELETINGYGTFIISVEWPYESGDDALDTYWGERSYEYNKLNPTDSSLKLQLTLIAQQKNQNIH